MIRLEVQAGFVTMDEFFRIVALAVVTICSHEKLDGKIYGPNGEPIRGAGYTLEVGE